MSRLAARPLVLAAVAALAGCGGGSEERTNQPRPPAPINVTAAVTDARVSVSPAAFGAGPIVLIVSNQSADARAVTLRTDATDDAMTPLEQTTSPIDPRATARLQVDVAQGRYTLSAGGGGIRPAAIEVGAPRPSASDALLQP